MLIRTLNLASTVEYCIEKIRIAIVDCEGGRVSFGEKDPKDGSFKFAGMASKVDFLGRIKGLGVDRFGLDRVELRLEIRGKIGEKSEEEFLHHLRLHILKGGG